MSNTETGRAFPALENAEFMVLTTYRADGTAVPTTVWFADVDGRLYVTTMDGTGKAKRLRANPQVQVAPATAQGSILGPACAALGRQLAQAEHATAEAALRAKYPSFAQIAGRVDDTVPGRSRTYLEILPAGS